MCKWGAIYNLLVILCLACFHFPDISGYREISGLMVHDFAAAASESSAQRYLDPHIRAMALKRTFEVLFRIDGFQVMYKERPPL